MTRAGAVLCLFLLGACGWVEVGGPQGTQERRAAPPKQQADVPGERRIRVRKGDSVYLVSRRYGVTMRDIIEQNGLTAPYHLQEGQTLTLPAPREHVVVAGDSLWSISRQYGVPMAALVRINGLKAPYTIYKDATLRIPSRTEPPPAGAVSDKPAPPLPVAHLRTALPPAGAGIPPVPRPAPAAGARLPSPAPRGADTAEPGKAAPVPRPPPAAGVSPPGPFVTARPEPLPKTVAAPPPAPVRTALKPLPSRVGRFLHPVEGTVMTGFGPQPDGLHNDGINIAAPRGAAVHATEAGRVAYSGNELPGYGNLLLIRHQGGWVSAYAHNEQLLVERGDEVRRGQRIALVGSSGRVTSPQLHFELRRQGRAVDPAPYLGGG